MFIEKGNAVYHVGNNTYEVGHHDIFIIGAMDRHTSIIGEVPYIRYGLYVLPAYWMVKPELSEYREIYKTPTPEQFQKLKNVDDSTFKEIIGIIRKLHEETISEENSSLEMVTALLWQLSIILKRLIRYSGSDIPVNSTYQDMINIKNYIDLNYSNELSLEELSRIFYMQPNTISQNFKRNFDINLNQYINMVRISHAVKILEQNSINITELSGIVGYSSVNTFLRQFKIITHKSPLQYRKNYLEHMKQQSTWDLFKNKRYPNIL